MECIPSFEELYNNSSLLKLLSTKIASQYLSSLLHAIPVYAEMLQVPAPKHFGVIDLNVFGSR